MSHDKLIVIGADEDLTKFAEIAEASRPMATAKSIYKYELKSLVLREPHPWVGKSIRESGIREVTDGLVVGIERKGQRILNPDSLMKLEVGDHLWIVGDPDKIGALI